MGRRYDTVTFLSDYGTTDEFAGVVKAVIRDLAPHAHVLDLTHGVPPFDVRGGSIVLARAIPYLPAGVVLAVVDPGVGSDRRAVAIEVADGDGVIIGPDNGLLAPAVALAGGAERAVVLDDPEHHLEPVGATFAGRDVFAPVVAALCNGVDLAELGTPIEPELLLPGVVPLPREESRDGQPVVVAEVVWVDRFGNCELNVGPDEVAGWGDRVRIAVGDAHDPVVRVAHVVSAFHRIPPGAVGLVVDSSGMLALAFDQRAASVEFGIGAGEQVVLAPVGDEGASTAPDPVQIRLGRSPGVQG